MLEHALPVVSGSVTFPALCVPRDFGVYVVRDLPQLQRSRAALFWRYRHFDGLRLYDSHEMAYEVTGSSVSKPISELGQFVARLLDLAVTVAVQISPIGPASLSDVVAAVQRAMEADPESLEELSQRSTEWWRTTLAHAASVREVIQAFGQPQNDG
jgi:hypothetical protein